MTVGERIRGKLRAARTLARLARELKNWRAVWDAYRGRRPCPPLEFRSGLRLEFGPEDDIISLYEEVFARQDYTSHGFYRPRPGDVVLDIGANIGTFALFLQHRCRGVIVHCFEPSAATRQRLEHNLRINRLESVVHVHPVGVSDAPRTLTLHGHRFAGSRSVLAAGAAGEGGEAIECVTLTEAVRRTGAGRIALLKIDVEGAEVDILREADPGTWAKIERVTLEFHGSLRSGARQAVSEALVARGFRIVHVFAPTPDGQDGVLQAAR
jgi:FkbM family methyltransferase